ncbi:hypothetical protein SIN8267_00489 [Sinobacterium norvegicum]|uniref:DUF1254 domain-containing protein n=1 Tax=Sinobacterium norvegicum TaxID=1641715 RepID=A0ABN8EHR6_9GAMM|nr:DUF1214 domain-containing protein [Sinobacterium norvegicum]CAH0990397.1 hypothetical protein SIN8267_00489 [Sinobacterium norvegicum]
MKKTILTLLVVAALATSYLLGTFNGSTTIQAPSAAWAEDSEAAKAWRQLSVAMDAAGEEVFKASADQQEQIDGLLYLTQLLSASLEMKLSKGNQAEPAFTDWMADYRKFLGDSPDAIYHTAEISSDYRYQISGTVADAEYLGMMLYGKALNGWNSAEANIATPDIRLDANGGFNVILSKHKPEDGSIDWLPMSDSVHLVMMRQYFHQRSKQEPATLNIVNLDSQHPVKLNDKILAKGLASATEFFNDTLRGSLAMSQMFAGAVNSTDVPKSYSQDFGGVFYPTHDNDYYGAWFDLQDDEALIIEGDVPNAPYWSVSLMNRWMQSLDYQHQPVALNDQQIETSQGRYRVIVSRVNPGSGNWISTAGYRQGMLAIRYQQSDGTASPTLQLVKYSELAE